MNTFETQLLNVLNRIATAVESISEIQSRNAQFTSAMHRTGMDRKPPMPMPERKPDVSLKEIQAKNGKGEGESMDIRTLQKHLTECDITPKDGHVTHEEARQLERSFNAAKKRSNIRRLRKKRKK
jgi:hypothetical protein